jgi:O-antigen ligase
LERFMTTFAGSEERDTSASTRLQYWQAGFAMLHDWPLGAGGDGFKRAGGKYMQKSQIAAGRSVHNGYINEACEWGIQGFILRMLFMGTCALCCFRTMDYQRQPGGNEQMAFFGSCSLAGMSAFMGTGFFGDYIDNEWGIWVAALCLAYARQYGPPAFVPKEQEIHLRPPQTETTSEPLPKTRELPNLKSDTPPRDPA